MLLNLTSQEIEDLLNDIGAAECEGMMCAEAVRDKIRAALSAPHPTMACATCQQAISTALCEVCHCLQLMPHGMAKVLTMVIDERARHDIMHGPSNEGNTDLEWLCILMEELGEAAKEVCELNYHRRADLDLLKAEVTQVAAVAVAWLERLNTRAAYSGDEDDK